MTRPCFCDQDGCRPCWLWHHSPRHRGAMGGDPKDATRPGHATKIGVKPKPTRKPPCVHRGEWAGKTQLCTTCAGVRKLKIYPCARFGLCVIAGDAGVKACAGCGEYRAGTTG